MIVMVYPHGRGGRCRQFTLPPDEAVKRYLDLTSHYDLGEMIAEPDDEEAAALPGWHPPEGEHEKPFRLYRVEATVTWTVTEVQTFQATPSGDPT